MALKQDLEWRYATKNYNGEKLPQDKLDYILDSVRLSASSMGLQPYKILVIENPDIRKKIRAVAWDQPQITDSSHLVLFAAWTNTSEEQAETYIQDIAEKRNSTREQLQDFHQMVTGFINGKSQTQLTEWAARQTYLALGTLLAAAAEQRVDATPMEGFDNDAVDEILGLKAKGLHSVVIGALGYRAPDDWLAPLAKVRRDKEKLFEFI